MLCIPSSFLCLRLPFLFKGLSPTAKSRGITQNLEPTKEKEEIELSHAFRVGDGVLLCHKVYHHFWGNDSGMAEINEGQAAEEIVHRGV